MLVLALGVAAGVGWRLYHGPISLRYAMPLMDKALNSADLGVDVSFSDTILTWDRPAHTLEVRAIGLSVREPGGGPRVASVPQASLKLSLPALLRGHIAPTEIRLIGPRLAALRQEDGRIVLVKGMGNGDDAARFLDALLTALRRPQSQDDSNMRFLTSVEIADALLSLKDEASGTEWRMPDGSLTLSRAEDGLTGDLSGVIRSGELEAHLDLKGDYTVADDTVRARLRMDGLNPRDVPAVLLPHPAFGGLDMDAVLTADLEYRMEGDATGTFDLAGEAGHVVLPEELSEDIAIDRLNVRGSYESAARRVRIAKAELVSGPLDIIADGVIEMRKDGPALSLAAHSDTVTMAELKRFWPVNVKPNTRAWIDEHLNTGTFEDVALTLRMDRLDKADVARPADALQLGFRFKDLDANYLKSMPAVTGAAGYGSLNLSDLKVHVTAARTLDLDISDGDIRIDDLDVADAQDADISLSVSGDIAEALRLIDYPPLRFPTKFGMKPESVIGTAATRAQFRFPLVEDLSLDDVQFSTASTLRDVVLPDLFSNTRTDDGHFLLRANSAGLEAEGTLSFNGVPFEVTWGERFGAGDGPPSRYTLKGDLSDAAWAALHLPFDTRISGSAPVSLTLLGKGKDILDGTGHLDLTQTGMLVPEFDWTKAPGTQAGMDFRFRTTDAGLDVQSYQMLAPDFAANGVMTLKPDFSLDHALVNMTIGISDMTLDVYGQRDKGYEIFADGRTVDLRPLLAFATAERKSDTPPFASLNFGGTFEKGILNNDVALSDMVVRANFIQGWWEGGYLLSKLGDKGEVSFTLKRDGANRVMALGSSDAGLLLDGLGYFASGEGGNLTIDATIDDAKEGSPVAGMAKIKGILLKDAPVMARILTLASFTGIADTLGGEGIRFDKVEAPFVLRDGVLSLHDAGAFGAALGLTVEGQMDRANARMDLGGSIIPSYTLNSFLGKIPLIGPIFSGKEGEGLIGFTYRVTGTVDDPNVSVNPLSALAPGFLRGIFREMDPPPSGKPKEPERQGTAAPVE